MGGHQGAIQQSLDEQSHEEAPGEKLQLNQVLPRGKKDTLENALRRYHLWVQLGLFSGAAVAVV